MFRPEIFVLIFLWFNITAQTPDKDWLLGYCIDCTPSDTTFGISHLDFSTEPPSVYYEYIDFSFNACNISMVDSTGEMLFYSNCIELFNGEHEALENSEDFNAYPFHDAYELTGLPLNQGILSLKFEDNFNVYGILHANVDWAEVNGDWGAVSWGLYYSIIDMDADDGLGKMIEKKVPIVLDTLSNGKLTATRHANGRDWWIITPEYNSNRYYRILFSPDGFELKNSQEIGASTINGLGQAVFSPDGEWYIRFSLIGGLPDFDYLDIYSFDRCTGLLSTPLRFSIGNGANSGGGVAVSPDSRYLYVTHGLFVYQYDLHAPDIELSKDTIAVYDGFSDPFPSNFFLSQLGPDGRIYISSTNGIRYLHRINYPNEQGEGCDLEQHIINLPTPNGTSVPNFPNYRLGPVDGSLCDTLNLDNFPQAKFRCYNDTIHPLLVDFTDLSWYQPENWFWDFGDGSTSDEISPQHTYDSPGTYQVCLTVSNVYGSDITCKEIEIMASSVMMMPKREITFKIYPNPANEHIMLRLNRSLGSNGRMIVFDMMGRKVNTYPLTPNQINYQIPINKLPAQLYYYQISSDGAILGSGTFVKE